MALMMMMGEEEEDYLKKKNLGVSVSICTVQSTWCTQNAEPR